MLASRPVNVCRFRAVVYSICCLNRNIASLLNMLCRSCSDCCVAPTRSISPFQPWSANVPASSHLIPIWITELHYKRSISIILKRKKKQRSASNDTQQIFTYTFSVPVKNNLWYRYKRERKRKRGEGEYRVASQLYSRPPHMALTTCCAWYTVCTTHPPPNNHDGSRYEAKVEGAWWVFLVTVTFYHRHSIGCRWRPYVW